MILGMIYSGSVKQLQILRQKAVTTLRSFLFGDYQRLHHKSSSFLGLKCHGKPKVQGSFREQNHDDANNTLCQSQALIMHEEQSHVTEIKGEGREEVVDFDSNSGERALISYPERQNTITNENHKTSTAPHWLPRNSNRNGNVCDKAKVEEKESGPVVSALDREELWVKLEKKLKEIVMEDAETLVDVQEFLYYYSRLRSPLFVNMVDRVFAEFFC